MRKVHITLVGGQPVPVYIGIKDDGQANTVVLVCSPESRVEAERIKAQFPKRNIILEECPPVALADIELLAMRLCEEYADCEKVLNLTSGTKLWSLTFFRVFHQDVNSRFVYIDQNNLITDILAKSSHVGSINTLKRFELYGTPLTSFRTLDEYNADDLRVVREIEKARNINRYDFQQLTGNKNLTDMPERDIITLDSGSQLEYSFDEKWALLKLNTESSPFIKELHCQHLPDILFNFGWFELKTAAELHMNENVTNIWLNCEFADSGGNTKNEIDIIAEFGNRLLFVECKTMIRDSTDIDKFRSALRNFSGTSSTGIFVTNDKPNAKTLQRYEHAMEKCKDNGILTFNFSLWKNNPVNSPTLKEIVNEHLKLQNKR